MVSTIVPTARLQRAELDQPEARRQGRSYRPGPGMSDITAGTTPVVARAVRRLTVAVQNQGRGQRSVCEMNLCRRRNFSCHHPVSLGPDSGLLERSLSLPEFACSSLPRREVGSCLHRLNVQHTACVLPARTKLRRGVRMRLVLATAVFAAEARTPRPPERQRGRRSASSKHLTTLDTFVQSGVRRSAAWRNGPTRSPNFEKNFTQECHMPPKNAGGKKGKGGGDDDGGEAKGTCNQIKVCLKQLREQHEFDRRCSPSLMCLAATCRLDTSCARSRARFGADCAGNCMFRCPVTRTGRPPQPCRHKAHTPAARS